VNPFGSIDYILDQISLFGHSFGGRNFGHGNRLEEQGGARRSKMKKDGLFEI
jgi:hypothetical protein